MHTPQLPPSNSQQQSIAEQEPQSQTQPQKTKNEKPKQAAKPQEPEVVAISPETIAEPQQSKS
jgi:hypothetical protein